ncbi:MAG: GNAT family N-acetyltransferase [Pseudomonadota bacterium]|nr:GNAT family N-acetyltransferase [Pseudomonadota bacterium]
MFARTERLLLRPGWREDAPALFGAIRDEGIVRNLASAPWPYRLADAEAFLASERGPTESAMLILLRTGGAPELIGTIGFGRLPDGEVEFGYWIALAHWGRGYATEAGRALVAIARHGLRLPRLAAGHFLDNPASGRVLEKLGFRATGRIVPRFSAGRGEAAPCRLYALDLGETQAQAETAIAA